MREEHLRLRGVATDPAWPYTPDLQNLLADYDALRAERDALKAALTELVTLKSIKTVIDVCPSAAAYEDYENRKPAAWRVANELVDAAHQETEAGDATL